MAVEVRGLDIAVHEASGNRIPIVRDISFAIPRGEVLALIGESGSGKTTIALALMGYSRFGADIAADVIRVGDMRIDKMSRSELTRVRGRRVSYIAQSAASGFNPSRTILSQVIEPLLVHRLADRKTAEARAVELFASLALPSPETIGSRYPHQVSGGQLQRVMVAMALITEPELVILDEPTTALDVTTQVEVLKTIKLAMKQSGATAIYVSHDLAVVAQVADRIAVLKDGTMCEEGSVEQILNAPASEYTRSLMAAAQPEARPDAQAAPDNVLTVSSITAGYGRIRDGMPAKPVLRDVSFSIRRGAALGVIGESGSGKSTLARVIAGLLPAAQGDVMLGDEVLPRAMARRSREQLRRVQIVFQHADTALNPAQTVREILARPLAFYHGLKGPAADARVAELLDLIQLPTDVLARRSSELSGGQKQRVNLARALAAEPDVLICDEVTSALDTVVAAAILDLIDDLRRNLGIATIFISHDISNAHAFCDDLLVLYAGSVVELVSRARFSEGLHHPYTRLLVDSVPEMDTGWLARRSAADAPAIARDAISPALCPFLPRCSQAIVGACDTEWPPRRERDGQSILCHRDWGELRPSGHGVQGRTTVMS
ncbi:ATP-binding cassette domain-containing protein [Croceicoccus ponticola]|uniref:ATP-binding cassette domain-containing protein n=1 Tax=Croceicoccus ponticola TaxID=2217664 RepID=A0A437H2Z7_9SPHN|nr:ATP-binding cassette domain-containing protein [Croceicoccus ponticola]